MKKALLVLAFVGGLGAATGAAAGVVNFNDISAPSTLGAPFSDGGLDFTPNGYYAAVWPNGPTPAQSNGSNLYIYAGTAGPLTITKTGGGDFNLFSFQLDQSWYAADTGDTITVSWDGPNAGSTTLNPTVAFQTFNLNILDATNVYVSPEYQGAQISPNVDGYWAMDNIYFSAGSVPEPASWAMMIGGLFSVGALARRRKMATAAIAS